MYIYTIKCCFYTQNGCMEKYITTVNSVTKHQIDSAHSPNPMFHCCTIASLNIAINKLRVRRVKLCALNTFEVTEQHQIFVRRC